MNKVICDICGTAYPETATHCPICGSPKRSDAASDSDTRAPAGNRKRTKGGYFSEANVRKRNQANQTPDREPEDRPEKPDGQKSNKGLTAAVVILVIAVLAVIAYIVVSFVIPAFRANQPAPETTTVPSTAAETAAQTTVPETTEAVCTDLQLSVQEITFDAAGREWLLEVVPVPADPAAPIAFASGDATVATVDGSGRIRAVGEGSTTITVSCGEVAKVCQVTCKFAPETTAPETDPSESTEASETTAPSEPEQTTEATEAPASGMTVYPAEDVTIAVDETFTLLLLDEQSSSVSAGWYSEDESICTVAGNTVTGIGSGNTRVRCEYNGRAYTCIVRVK